MAMTTSKEIFSTHNFLDPEKNKKRSKHEFQAFAYKIAHDLNDLVNLKIYMRLSKSVERSIMERAYSFAIDSSSDERGKLFFWKLKGLRKELREYVDARNFDYDFVMKKMKKFRDTFAKKMLKVDESFTNFVKEILPDGKLKILVFGCTNRTLFEELTLNSYKFKGVDLSSKVISEIKEQFPQRKSSFISKDIIAKPLSDTYRMIVLYSVWPFVPLDSELKFIDGIANHLDEDGIVILDARFGEDDSQSWQNIKGGEINHEYLMKFSDIDKLCERFDVMGLKLISKRIYEKNAYLAFQKINR